MECCTTKYYMTIKAVKKMTRENVLNITFSEKKQDMKC